MIYESSQAIKNGQSQAVRLPKEFRFEGTKVFVKRLGNAVLLLPEQHSRQGLFDSLGLFSDDFMEARQKPEEEEREELFE